jgi:hypothetical protein
MPERLSLSNCPPSLCLSLTQFRHPRSVPYFFFSSFQKRKKIQKKKNRKRKQKKTNKSKPEMKTKCKMRWREEECDGERATELYMYIATVYAHRNQVRVSIRLIIRSWIEERDSWGSSHVSPRVSVMPRLDGSSKGRRVGRSFSYFTTGLTRAVHAVLVRACAINSRLISVIHIHTPYLKGRKLGRKSAESSRG